MRHIGIIGAMEEEVAILKEKMTDVTVEKKASMEFYSGRLNGKEAVIVRSGIGKVNAGICTQILADDFHVDAVINTGVAGSLRAEINIGDIVLSTDTLQHDMDAQSFENGAYRGLQRDRVYSGIYNIDRKELSNETYRNHRRHGGGSGDPEREDDRCNSGEKSLHGVLQRQIKR